MERILPIVINICSTVLALALFYINYFKTYEAGKKVKSALWEIIVMCLASFIPIVGVIIQIFKLALNIDEGKKSFLTKKY